ncbi:flavodoxin family protein [Chryseobacterium indologenes]|uniref:flavodoxin family protein n=1 Tax=Chryseobacterium indologenes TaxID=253 RepID=UPI0040590F86
MFWIALGIIMIGVFIFSIIIVSIDSYQYHRNKNIIKSLSQNGDQHKNLVVFFSRSGNTELMARKIAEMKHAAVIPIQSDRDHIGFTGWIEALQDARNTASEITPGKIDLSKYDTIYIGSPIWLYSPAPQIFEFARNNNFTGKKVILFNSMNSKFEQKYIDDFKAIIEKNGGTFVQHLYIIRGRMTQQVDVEEFLKKTMGVVQSID